MKRSTRMIVLAILPLILAACGKPAANPDDPQYKLGFAAGHEDGRNEMAAEICGKAEDFKHEIAEALRDQKICPEDTP